MHLGGLKLETLCARVPTIQTGKTFALQTEHDLQIRNQKCEPVIGV